MRRTLVIMLLLAVAAPLAASEPTSCAPDLAALFAAPDQTPAELPGEIGTPEFLTLGACEDDCYLQSLNCLDECEASPYLLCHIDCRRAGYRCIADCP
jgi:hypothetical protein